MREEDAVRRASVFDDPASRDDLARRVRQLVRRTYPQIGQRATRLTGSSSR
jgi:hypothetical protein